MEGLKEIINQIGQYIPVAIMLGVPIAIGVHMVRVIPRQNREQYQQFQQMKSEFDANPENYGKAELIDLYKRMIPIRRGLIGGKKGKEIRDFNNNLSDKLFIYVMAEIQESVKLNKIPYNGQANLEDLSQTYRETLSPRKR